MTPGVAIRSGPAHAKRNPEPAGGSAPCRHTTKSEGRAGSPKNIARHATERSVSRLGPTSAARKSDRRRNSRTFERPAGPDPQFRPSGKTAGTQSDRLPHPAKTAAGPRTARQTDRTRFSDRRQANDMRTSGNATIHSPRRPTEDSPDSKTPQKKAGEGDPTRNHDNGIPERQHAPSLSGKPATHGTPSQPCFGTFRSGEPPSRYRIPQKTEGHNKNSNQEQPITLPTPHRWPSTLVPHEKTSSGTGRVPRTEPSGKKRRGRRRNPDFRPPVVTLAFVSVPGRRMPRTAEASPDPERPIGD